MSEILRFLLRRCSFLYESGHFRFVDSLNSNTSFGDAFVVLASERVCLRFVRERGQLFLELRAPHREEESEWFSIDIVRQHLTGQIQESAELDDEYAAFLRGHLEQIESLFEEQNLAASTRAFHDLESVRAKRLFG